MEFRKEEIVVLGGGLMGSSAAWQVAKSGRRVILLEQQDREYNNGSSFGEARICRSLGPKNDIWSYLHRRAVSESEKLVSFLDNNDSDRHSMEDIYTTSPVTYLFKTTKKEAVRRMLRQQNDKYSYASSPEEAHEIFNTTLAEDQIIIQEYRLHTGTINPKALISKLHLALGYKNSEVIYGQKVEEIRHENDGYHLLTTDKKTGDKTTWHTRQIVSALGPYTSHLLSSVSPKFTKLITPERVALSFFSISSNRYESYSVAQKEKIKNFFPYIDLNGDHVFAMIEKMVDGRPLFKIGGHFLREKIDNLDDMWNKEISESEIEWARKQLTGYFRILGIPLLSDGLVYEKGYSCVYSLTPNEVPIVDNVHPDLILMGGFSGVGAKGAMTYGLIASNLLSGVQEDEFMYLKVVNALKKDR